VVAAVDHDACEAAVHAAFAQFKRIAVIEVQADGQVGFNDRRLDELHQVGMVGVFACAGADLQDQRGAEFLGCFRDALYDLHVVHVERADGVAAGVSFFKHFGAGNKCHRNLSPLTLFSAHIIHDIPI
jgi:hypothetical protein